jgi:hypothetical protein
MYLAVFLYYGGLDGGYKDKRCYQREHKDSGQSGKFHASHERRNHQEQDDGNTKS